jgi:hypothetical protein
MFFDKHLFESSQPPLSSLTIELACDLAKLRHTENITEVGEEILVQCLLDIVPDKQLIFWLQVKKITRHMEEQFDGKQDWLTTNWVGKALRRLGFSDKRRVGTGYEYNIPRKDVLDLKERMQIEELKEEPKPQEPEVKSCFLCRMALPTDHSNMTMMDGKEVHVWCFKQVNEGKVTEADQA